MTRAASLERPVSAMASTTARLDPENNNIQVMVNNNNHHGQVSSPTHYAVPKCGSLRLQTALPDFNKEKTDMGKHYT